MELIKGQNISLSHAKSLVIDLGWRSLVTDLNMQAHGIYQGVQSSKGDKPKAQLIYQEDNEFNSHITRTKDGRRFELDLDQISHMQTLTIALILPSSTRYNFSKVKHIQAFINTREGDKIATIKLPSHDEDAQSMDLLEIYQHNGQWKLKLNALSSAHNLIEMADSFNLELPDSLKPRVAKVATAPEPAPAPIKAVQENTPQAEVISAQPLEDDLLRDGVKLSMGSAYSLTKNVGHLQHLVWKVRTTPKLADIKLNVLALTKHNRVRTFEDFIYSHNPELEGTGVRLRLQGEKTLLAHIELDKIPSDITKLCLIATRESQSKRLSSADFIQTKLESANTRIPVCDFSCATVNKNYNCIILLEIYRHDSQWKVKAIGQGYAQGLQAIGEAHGFSAPRSLTRRTATEPQNTTNSNTTLSYNSSSVSQANIVAPAQSIPTTTGLLGIIMTVLGLLTIGVGLLKLLLFPLIASVILIGIGGFVVIDSRKKANKKLVEENERFMLNAIKRNNYQVTPFQIATNYAISVEQATTLLDALCRKGAGKLESKEDGSQVYVFDALNSAKLREPEQW